VSPAESELRQRVEQLLGKRVARLESLHGGMIADVRSVELASGECLVAKLSRDTPLSIEGKMLEFLARFSSLPVPRVVHADDELLLLERLAGRSFYRPAAERQAAELLAGLHETGPADAGLSPVEAERFGFPFDTLIGPFSQANDWNADWAEFYRERRLVPMLAECEERGRLPRELGKRLERLLAELGTLLDHSPEPGLVHGDVWSGNVLAEEGRITGFLDPALYFADPEVELAFIDLFDTFGTEFWNAYRDRRAIDAGYLSRRRDVYQLYPLLVHVALFGGSYVGALGVRLARLGY
jgi:fructosamine-3-kinase